MLFEKGGMSWRNLQYASGQNSQVRVSPDLYIALGIRGDTMHAFGMQDARFVVAVHPDPDALIFRQADVGIVGEPAAVADELMKLLNYPLLQASKHSAAQEASASGKGGSGGASA